jgi:hypothetical protein
MNLEEQKIEKLKQTLISGSYCHENDPFRSDNGYEAIYEEFRLWQETCFLKLCRILGQKTQKQFYALEYRSDGKGGIEYRKLHTVDVPANFAAYTKAGFDTGFTINGLEFFLFDDTFSWCIGTTTDVQFITGDATVMALYFESDQEKQAITEAFIKEFARPEMSPGYGKMKNYIRLKK